MKNQTESTRFLEAARQLVSIPKAEIDKRDAAWKKQRDVKKSK